MIVRHFLYSLLSAELSTPKSSRSQPPSIRLSKNWNRAFVSGRREKMGGGSSIVGIKVMMPEDSRMLRVCLETYQCKKNGPVYTRICY